MDTGDRGGTTGAAAVRVMTTPVPNHPFTSIEPISGDSRSSCASPLTSFSSIDLIPGTFCSSSASSFISWGRHTRVRYLSSRRSTRITWPSSMKSGTCTVAPVSSVAGLVAPVAVSPRTPGSVRVTASSTKDGSSTENHPVVVDQPLALHPFLQVLQLIGADELLGQHDVVERLLVHEVVEVAVGVGELHRPALQPHVGDPLAGVVGPVDARRRCGCS